MRRHNDGARARPPGAARVSEHADPSTRRDSSVMSKRGGPARSRCSTALWPSRNPLRKVGARLQAAEARAIFTITIKMYSGARPDAAVALDLAIVKRTMP
jgi:hypothetical protein